MLLMDPTCNDTFLSRLTIASENILGNFLIHIFRLLSFRPPSPPPFKKKKNQINLKSMDGYL